MAWRLRPGHLRQGHLRQVSLVEFRVDELSRVLVHMVRLADAGEGWINLTAATADDEPSAALGFFTLFGGGATGAVMSTWVARGDGHGGRAPSRLGITHNAGYRLAAPRGPFILPRGWFVEQDHPRRGLVLRIPPDESLEAILRWALETMTALTPDPPPPAWRAEVHLPATS